MGDQVAAEGGWAVQDGPYGEVESGQVGDPDGDPGTAAEGAAAEGAGAPVVVPSASSAAGVAAGSCTDVGLILGSTAGFGDAATGAEFDHGATTGSASGAASSAWPEGMDPNSSYYLKIRLLGNPKKARKDVNCFCFNKIIDSDLTNYKDFVASIVEEYPPRYLEVALLQYYDDVMKTFPEIKSDQELMTMFEKKSETKFVQMFISYYDPSEPCKPITEYYTEHN